jgi:hypothetical protein
VIADRPKMGDMPLTRGYDPARDGPLLRAALQLVTRFVGAISVQDLDRDDTPTGKPLIYTGLLKEVQPPQTDRNGTDTAMLRLVFHIWSVA